MSESPHDEQPVENAESEPAIGEREPFGRRHPRIPTLMIALIFYVILGCLCLGVAVAIAYRVSSGR